MQLYFINTKAEKLILKILLARLCGITFSSTLLPPNKLCMDAVRRILLTHSSCVCFYIRKATS